MPKPVRSFESILCLVSSNGIALKSLPKQYCSDKVIALAAIEDDERAYKYISSNLQQDFDFFLDIVETNVKAIQWAPKDILNNESIMKKAVELNPASFMFAGPSVVNNRDIVLSTVKQNGKYLSYAAIDVFSNDLEVVECAMESDWSSLQYASYDIRNNYHFMKKAIIKCFCCLKYATFDIKNNKDIALLVTSLRGPSLTELPFNMKDDKEVVLSAVKQRGMALKYASDRLKEDLDIVLEALHSSMNDHVYNAYFVLSPIMVDKVKVYLQSVLPHFDMKVYTFHSTILFGMSSLHSRPPVALKVWSEHQNTNESETPPSSTPPTSLPSITAPLPAISKLRALGPYHSVFIKKHIAEYAGVQMGEYYNRLDTISNNVGYSIDWCEPEVPIYPEGTKD